MTFSSFRQPEEFRRVKFYLESISSFFCLLTEGAPSLPARCRRPPPSLGSTLPSLPPLLSWEARPGPGGGEGHGGKLQGRLALPRLRTGVLFLWSPNLGSVASKESPCIPLHICRGSPSPSPCLRALRGPHTALRGSGPPSLPASSLNPCSAVRTRQSSISGRNILTPAVYFEIPPEIRRRRCAIK